MGKRIMHSARALFLTFLAPEKSKRNNTLHENYAAAKDLQRIKLHRKDAKNAKIKVQFLCKFCDSAVSKKCTAVKKIRTSPSSFLRN
jgi:hypothetical protein